MWMGARTLTTLLVPALLSGPAVAEEEGQIADKARIAIGFSVLSNEATGMSLWRIRSKSMIGFGVNLYLSSTKAIYETETKSRLSVRVRPSFTIKQIRSRHKIASFSYQRLSAYINRDSQRRGEDRTWYAEAEIGIGFSWRPSEKASLSLGQGLALGYRQFKPSGTELIRTDTKSFRVPSTRILVLYHF